MEGKNKDLLFDKDNNKNNSISLTNIDTFESELAYFHCNEPEIGLRMEGFFENDDLVILRELGTSIGDRHASLFSNEFKPSIFDISNSCKSIN